MERFWEIDFFRGIAVVLMVLFNYAFTLQYLRIYYLDLGWTFWWLFPRIIAAAFMFIAGLSLSISYARLKNKRKAPEKYLLRGGKIFSLGLLITFATLIFAPSAFIVFGILHFLGAAIALSPLYLRLKDNRLLAAAAASLALGAYLQTATFDFPWLLWLGFVPEGFSTLDYFPLLPWMGFVFLGLYSGKKLYAKGKRRFKVAKQLRIAFPCLLGRHSLLIYMLHQPALIAVLLLAGLVI